MRGLNIKKQSRPDTPLASTPEPINGGTYYASSNGRVGRLSSSSIGDVIVGTRNESIDTTGYSKGREVFKKTINSSSDGSEFKDVKRKDVPKIISELKSGSTKNIDYRTINQKNTNKL